MDQEMKDMINKLTHEVMELRSELEKQRTISLLNSRISRIIIADISENEAYPNIKEQKCPICLKMIKPGDRVNNVVVLDTSKRDPAQTGYSLMSLHANCVNHHYTATEDLLSTIDPDSERNQEYIRVWNKHVTE